MKIKQEKAIKAYLSVQKLNGQETRIPTAMKIFNMYTKLRKAWDFQVQEEEKLYERHPKIDRTIGGIKADNDEDRKAAFKEIQQFNQEASEIGDLEIDVEIEPFTIRLNEEPGIKLSGEDIGNLSEFIKFE